jgi:hypothetical protein
MAPARERLAPILSNRSERAPRQRPREQRSARFPARAIARPLTSLAGAIRARLGCAVPFS